MQPARRRRSSGAFAGVRSGLAPLLVLASLTVGALAGCTNHRVGPARTFDDFERKARTTAEDSLSAIETVRMIADASTAGDTFGPFASISISEQEDELVEIQGDFGSIQPPTADADALRDRLSPILDAAAAHVADVRVVIRRGQLDRAADAATPLAGDAAALRAFLESL